MGWHHPPSFSSFCVCPYPWREKAEGKLLPADQHLERLGADSGGALGVFLPTRGWDCTGEAEGVATTVELTEWGLWWMAHSQTVSHLVHTAVYGAQVIPDVLLPLC